MKRLMRGHTSLGELRRIGLYTYFNASHCLYLPTTITPPCHAHNHIHAQCLKYPQFSKRNSTYNYKDGNLLKNQILYTCALRCECASGTCQYQDLVDEIHVEMDARTDFTLHRTDTPCNYWTRTSYFQSRMLVNYNYYKPQRLYCNPMYSRQFTPAQNAEHYARDQEGFKKPFEQKTYRERHHLRNFYYVPHIGFCV